MPSRSWYTTMHDGRPSLLPDSMPTRLIDDVEVALDAGAELAEGPLWAPPYGLLWVDIPKGVVHRFDPDTAADTIIDVGTMVGAVAPCADSSGLVGAVGAGFSFIDPDTGAATQICSLGDPAAVRMNDGKCDPQGRFWAGAMAMDARAGAGTLYCLGADGAAVPRLGGLTIPNGIDWSPDGRTMYYVDSPTRRLDAFDFDPDDGVLSNRRPVAELEEGILPDGLTVDADGCVWVAMWDGWGVRRFTPDGVFDTVVRLPVPKATSCTFGGTDLRDLYITTAADPEHGPGAVYRCAPGVQGLPANEYAR